MTEVNSKEALEFARKHMRIFMGLRGNGRDLEKTLYKDKAGRRETSRTAGGRYYVYDGSESAQLVEAAKYDPVAFEAAKELCVEILRRGEAIPEPLSNWLADYLESGKKPRNRAHKARNAIRDSAFVAIIQKLKEAGYKPIMHGDENYQKTANSSGESACNIVAEVYTEITGESIEAQTVRKVWNKWKDEETLFVVTDNIRFDHIGGDSQA